MAKQKNEKLIRKVATGCIKEVADDKTKDWDIEVICSTNKIDRSGEIIEQSGWQLDNFLKNPVCLAGHKHVTDDGTSPVVGHFFDIGVVGDKLIGKIKFAEGTTLGDQYRKLYMGKHQRAVSVGFRSMARETRKVDGENVLVHTKCELYEVSCVAVPCQDEAVRVRSDEGGEYQNPEILKAIADLKGHVDEKFSDIEAKLKSFDAASLIASDRISEIKELITGAGEMPANNNGCGCLQDEPAADSDAAKGQEPDTSHLKRFIDDMNQTNKK